MKKALLFSNPGSMDINLVKLLGVSVKEGDSPIGFFGTGLKYAIASALRLGGQISIFTQGERFDLSGEKLTLRDKEFTRVTINKEPLGFTTDLGKQWEPWMVVRELYSNALDEGGRTEVVDMGFLPSPLDDHTYVLLEGECFLDAWGKKDVYFLNLNEKALQESPHSNVYEPYGQPTSLYYRGIRVHESQQPFCFRYNVQGKLTLTEDRTVMHVWQLKEIIEATIIVSQDTHYIEKVLTCGEKYFEGQLSFTDSSLMQLDMSVEFDEVCSRLAARKPLNLNRLAIRYHEKRTKKIVLPQEVELSPMQQMQLDKACAFIRSIGFKDDFDGYPIKVINWLGENIYGKAEHDQIFLTKQAFDLGTHKLAAIILEEFVHCHYNLYDESRDLQSWLFERIITLGEEHVLRAPL